MKNHKLCLLSEWQRGGWSVRKQCVPTSSTSNQTETGLPAASSTSDIDIGRAMARQLP